MKIFDPIVCGNAADTANGCQMMSYSHVEKDLNRNEHSIKSSIKHFITAAFFYQNNFSQNKLDIICMGIATSNCSRY